MTSAITLLLSLLPESISGVLLRHLRNARNQLALLLAYSHDWRQYRGHSGLFRPNDLGVIEANIIMAYHKIEKGLALSEPRPGFGEHAVRTVLDSVDQYLMRAGPTLTTRRALNTLNEYVAFNQRNNHDVGWLQQRLATLNVRSPGSNMEGGTLLVTRADILRAGALDLSAFYESRYSIRQFSPEPIADDIITKAVSMSRKTPSVCNRQSACVFVASSSATKAALLALQNGNRGFGDNADRILVITSRMDTFLTVGERYQCWIDGGMFAMSLIYALHSLGVGTCCLNWSVAPDMDDAIKQLPGIPKDHAVVMLLAIGHLPSELLVAQSPRRNIGEVLHFI